MIQNNKSTNKYPQKSKAVRRKKQSTQAAVAKNHNAKSTIANATQTEPHALYPVLV